MKYGFAAIVQAILAQCAGLRNVMPGLVPGIHALLCVNEGVDGRDIGERSDAVLRDGYARP
jgi:hypothetical protein